MKSCKITKGLAVRVRLQAALSLPTLLGTEGEICCIQGGPCLPNSFFSEGGEGGGNLQVPEIVCEKEI